eukprot:1409128-Pleurochrysis_carterae.AAC.1
MAAWARGIDWDCSDLACCVPVERSTRHTQFEGARQVDWTAVRAATAEMRWADTDIVDQAGEGG